MPSAFKWACHCTLREAPSKLLRSAESRATRLATLAKRLGGLSKLWPNGSRVVDHTPLA